MKQRRILVVEDSADMLAHILTTLREIDDIVVDPAHNEASARTLISKQAYTVALIDIELGAMVSDKFAGLAIARDLTNTGCVCLVVSGETRDVVLDIARKLNEFDVIGKPFSAAELIGKVKHALEWASTRQSVQPRSAWPIGLTTEKDNPARLVWNGKPVQLTPIESTLVRLLANSHGMAVSKDALMHALKSGNSRNAVNTHITNVRKKFRDIDPGFNKIRPKPGYGFTWGD